MLRWRDHSSRGAEEDGMTARAVAAVMAGTAAWYLHPQHSPWPASGTVPTLDVIELRNPGA